MAPLRPLPYREVKRKLEAAGFVESHQKGSHVKFWKLLEDNTVRTAIVPHHREVTIGTLRSVLRQAGLSPAQFEEL